MVDPNNFYLKVVKGFARSVLIVVGLFITLSYGFATVVLLFGKELNGNALKLVCLLVSLSAVVLVSLIVLIWWYYSNICRLSYIYNDIDHTKIDRKPPNKELEDLSDDDTNTAGGNGSKLVVLLVAVLATFSFSQNATSAPSTGLTNMSQHYDTVVTVHRTIADSVTIAALKNSQTFFSNSFTWLLAILGIVIAALGFFDVKSIMGMRKEVKRRLKDHKNDIRTSLSDNKKEIQKEVQMEVQKQLEAYMNMFANLEKKVNQQREDLKTELGSAQKEIHTELESYKTSVSELEKGIKHLKIDVGSL